MLKKINFDNGCDNGFVLVGRAKEIERTYKKMCEKCTELYPLFLDEHKLNPIRTYGIEVSEEMGAFRIINAEWVIFHLLNELDKKER